MRSILYSPGFGAGWVSWHGGSVEQLRFMLEYGPFIEAVKAGRNPCDMIERFEQDWSARFPGVDSPYCGGVGKLRVMDVPDGARVRITEYDGSEKVVVEGSDEGWL